MRRLRLILVGAGGALLGMLLLVLSGLIDVASSSRQSGLTDWLWSMAVRQSVTFRSAGIEVPPLTDPAMIRRGAAHYDLVCAACHGSPTSSPEPFAEGLMPSPPLLMEQMEAWRPPRRIFWTVKHGIRHSAMPAWPTQLRDDEVWAMVAFLLDMPEMTDDAYAALAGRNAASLCERCHGDSASETHGAFPRLNIQSPQYLTDALRAFRDRTRMSGTMMTAAAGLTDREITALAETYGRLATTAAPSSRPGEDIAFLGIPERKVPPCESCHGPEARPDFPRLGGQERDYILGQLRLFATLGEARGGRYVKIMAEAVRGMTEADMATVADWYGR